MKEMRRNIRILGIILLCCFIGTGGWFGYTVYSQGSRWMMNSSNTRLNEAKSKVDMGSITDVNGVVLAYTDSEGNRQYNEDKYTRRAMSQTVGDTMGMSGTGVEVFHSGTLLGFSGNLVDRVWQWLKGETYKGENIRLTVDSQLSRYISRAFPDGKRGAVVVMNYKTGEIMSMVSKPDYDPNNLSNRSSSETEDTAYLNRVLQGQYAPGSVMKIVTTAAALENINGITRRTFTCDGEAIFGDGKVTDAGNAVHGEIDLMTAFKKSCNITYAGITYELGLDKLLKTAEQMGFNDNFSFRDIILYESSLPEDTTEVSELVWSGVGQGRVLVTPLHMCMIAGSVANGGNMMEPQLIDAITGVGGIERFRTSTGVYRRAMSEETAQVIKQYMAETVLSGTATAAQIEGYTVCGKTGSAETSDDKSVETNAWFVGFIDDEEHPYCVAVVVEQGGSGGRVAAPLAKKALQKAIELNS